jgi:hypothetical protein
MSGQFNKLGGKFARVQLSSSSAIRVTLYPESCRIWDIKCRLDNGLQNGKERYPTQSAQKITPVFRLLIIRRKSKAIVDDRAQEHSSRIAAPEQNRVAV